MRYETPDALRRDARTLTEEARAMLEATSDITDEKVAEARQRLTEALDSGKQVYGRLSEKATQTAQATDQAIRNNPYQSIAISFGVGALLGFIFGRRRGD